MGGMQKLGFTKALPWILVIAGTIGIVCSLILTRDQIKIWQTPGYQPACNLNPVVSCSSVINSKQGDLFDIPAPFFGLLVFPVLATIGVALWAGARFKRWFWLGMESGAISGFLAAIWLFLLSVYRIHALCPFCLVTDVAIYTAVWYLTLYNIGQGFIRLPKWAERASNFAQEHHLDLLILWFLLVLIFILHHFWYYYGRYF